MLNYNKIGDKVSGMKKQTAEKQEKQIAARCASPQCRTGRQRQTYAYNETARPSAKRTNR